MSPTPRKCGGSTHPIVYLPFRLGKHPGQDLGAKIHGFELIQNHLAELEVVAAHSLHQRLFRGRVQEMDLQCRNQFNAAAGT